MTDKADLNRPSIRENAAAYSNSRAHITKTIATATFGASFRDGFTDAMDNFRGLGGLKQWVEMHNLDRQRYLDALLLMRANYKQRMERALTSNQRTKISFEDEGFQWGRVVIAHLHRDWDCSKELADLVEVAIP
ncbi:hypothetical protein DVT68_19845 [Dyella solisilvae]|uniref:Uncharacterized protein n=1 Tax=Dyella solisilvae TaxID=1920168 RepID=A0A370K2J1_9GAMM|nr:hypothetical protein [Dyella solisilvae]RDI96808.1 hypothetical protein DVT68_19845 [Dyella solisilvae]